MSPHRKGSEKGINEILKFQQFYLSERLYTFIYASLFGKKLTSIEIK